MIQKNPFLKYLIKDEKKDIFHSSAHAKAQSGHAMGAASSESFDVRVKVNQNRQLVRGYHDSRVMTETARNVPRAKTYTPQKQTAVSSGAATVNQVSRVPMRRSGISFK